MLNQETATKKHINDKEKTNMAKTNEFSMELGPANDSNIRSGWTSIAVEHGYNWRIYDKIERFKGKKRGSKTTKSASKITKSSNSSKSAKTSKV